MESKIEFTSALIGGCVGAIVAERILYQDPYYDNHPFEAQVVAASWACAGVIWPITFPLAMTYLMRRSKYDNKPLSYYVLFWK